MRVKFGYSAFASKVLPITHPKRPFDKRKDLVPGMGIFVYLTPTGLVAKTKRDTTSLAVFSNYTDDGCAYIWVQEINRWRIVNPANIHIKGNA